MKKYMAYSFCTLWTLVLIIGLAAAIIHQVRFQDSPSELHLKHEISALVADNRGLELRNQRLRSSLHKSEIKYDNYREWVLSWR